MATISRGTIVAVAIWTTIVLACLLLAFCQWQGGQRAATEAKLGKSQSGAAIESGADAVTVIGTSMEAEARADALTKENDDAIRNADGAAAPVAAPVRDAGLRSLCARRAYRSDPKCVQQADPR